MINWISDSYMVSRWTWELCLWYFGPFLGLFCLLWTRHLTSVGRFLLERRIRTCNLSGPLQLYHWTDFFKSFNFKMNVFNFSFLFNGNLNYWRSGLRCRLNVEQRKKETFITFCDKSYNLIQFLLYSKYCLSMDLIYLFPKVILSLVLFPFYKWINWDSTHLKLPKVTVPVSDRIDNQFRFSESKGCAI